MDMNEKYGEIDRKGMGSRIKARREALNMTRKELAERIPISAKYMADIEYGTKLPAMDKFFKLVQVLGVSSDYLFFGDEADMPDDERKKRLSENILGSLSVCNVKQLQCMESFARLYVDSVVNKE